MSAERYRAQAEWARAKAETATSPELRQQWLDIVRQYELLAQSGENPKTETDQ